MQIKKAEFITSIADVGKYLEVSQTYECPEICVVGRSNVGKSSFINSLTGRNKLAKTSSTPGRTRLINLFGINDGQFILVDLPGYGYAAAPETEKRKWGMLIEGYLCNSKKLKHVISLVDIRHPPSALDEQMLSYLYHYSLPFTVVATKSDKLPRSRVAASAAAVANGLKIGRDNVIAYSGVSGQGRDAVLARLSGILENAEG